MTPPEVIPGTPFRPVIFEGLTVTPRLADRSKRLAYSLRAWGMRPVSARGAATAAGDSKAA